MAFVAPETASSLPSARLRRQLRAVLAGLAIALLLVSDLLPSFDVPQALAQAALLTDDDGTPHDDDLPLLRAPAAVRPGTARVAPDEPPPAALILDVAVAVGTPTASPPMTSPPQPPRRPPSAQAFESRAPPTVA